MAKYLIDPMTKSGIYGIVHIDSGRIYVGSAVDLKRRKREHFNRLDSGTHFNAKLQNAWAKYGRDQFRFDVLVLCPREELVAQEQAHIDALDVVATGFNLRPTANSNLGYRHTPETIAKIKKANTGHVQSEERRAAARGRTISEETRAILVTSHLGKKDSAETRARKSAAGVGRAVSAETRAAIAATKIGKKRPPFTEKALANMRAAQTKRQAQRTAQ